MGIISDFLIETSGCMKGGVTGGFLLSSLRLALWIFFCFFSLFLSFYFLFLLPDPAEMNYLPDVLLPQARMLPIADLIFRMRESDSEA